MSLEVRMSSSIISSQRLSNAMAKPTRPRNMAEVDWVAREAVRSAVDDGGGRQVSGDVRSGPGDSNDGPGDQRQREDKHHPERREVGVRRRRKDFACVSSVSAWRSRQRDRVRSGLLLLSTR
jgi:hypothetical protein